MVRRGEGKGWKERKGKRGKGKGRKEGEIGSKVTMNLVKENFIQFLGRKLISLLPLPPPLPPPPPPLPPPPSLPLPLP